MNKKCLTNKLSIYLIKKGYTNDEDILRNYSQLKHQKISNTETFYYGTSHNFTPAWLKKFFNDRLGDDIDIFNANAKGILLVEIKKDRENRIFAIAFGYGWQSLKPGVFEERFGLNTALSIIDSNNLRKIYKKNMVNIPKDTSEQLSKFGVAADFGINIEQDLLCSVTGKSVNKEQFGKTVTGKDALSLSVKVNMSSIKDFLMLCYEKYLSDDYKKSFDWIDQIAEIKDPLLIESLNDKLVENLKTSSLSKTWMAVPEIVDWEHILGFKYSKRRDEDLKEDIDIDTFLASLSEDEKINLTSDSLKSKTVFCIGSENEEVKYQWNTYNCLYYEEQEKEKTYLLSNGKWYEVETNFAQQVNTDFHTIKTTGSTVRLPLYKHKNEPDYNKTVSSGDNNIYCMDRKMIQHGGAYSKIEFCDLITTDKKIIHVKHYGGSSVLSHLFSQGLVSGELFLGDSQFREKVNELLPSEYRLENVQIRPNPSDYEIVYAIISMKPDELDIPFFSKVNLKNARKRLETFGYKVSLIKISTEGSER